MTNLTSIEIITGRIHIEQVFTLTIKRAWQMAMTMTP